MAVTVYTKPSCVQCTATYRALNAKGIEFEIFDVSVDEKALQAVKDLGYLQVFTPTGFPAADGTARLAIAIEPMTAPPDALRSGDGLVWLEPGAQWSGSWGLRLA